MDSQEIIERIMTAHWDLTACRCWICEAGQKLGFHARDRYLQHKHGNRQTYPDPADCEAVKAAIAADAEGGE